MPASGSEATQSPGDHVFVRKALPDETARVRQFFRNVPLPAQSRFFVAMKSHPIERIIASSAWWLEGVIAKLRLAYLPGLLTATRVEVTRAIVRCVEDGAKSAGISSLHYAELLGDEHEMCHILRESGFQLWRSERHFEIPGQDAWTRVMRMYNKYKDEIPADWRTDAIRLHPADLVLDLIRDYRLMIPGELRNYWRTDSPFGFELDLSSILFAGTKPIGALLTRRVQDALCIDVRVVRLERGRLRALGNIALLYHIAERCGPSGPIKWLRFRGGEIEHLETANLAFRMGGRELPHRHVFTKSCAKVPSP